MFQLLPFPAATQHFDATRLHIFLLTPQNTKLTTKNLPPPLPTTIIKNKNKTEAQITQ